MLVLQWLLRALQNIFRDNSSIVFLRSFIRKFLYENTPNVRSSIRRIFFSLLAKLSALNRKHAKANPGDNGTPKTPSDAAQSSGIDVKKGSSTVKTENHDDTPSTALPSTTTDAIVTCASAVPGSSTLHPYPLNYNSSRTSMSSMDIGTSNHHWFHDADTGSRPRPASTGIHDSNHNRLSQFSHTSRLSLRSQQSLNPTSTPHNRSGEFAAHPNYSTSRIAYPSVSGFPHGRRGRSPRPSPQPSANASRISLVPPPSVFARSASPASLPPDIVIERSRTQDTQDFENVGGLDVNTEGYELTPVMASPTEELSYTLAGNVADPARQQLQEVYNCFYTMAPEAQSRYQRESLVDKKETSRILEPMTTKFDVQEVPLGWEQRLHIEGAGYFVYEKKKFYTDANILSPDILRLVTLCMNRIDNFVQTNGIELHPGVNIVLDVTQDPEFEDGFYCQYYMVDHKTKTVFWLDEFDTGDLSVWGEVKGATELEHIRHEIETQYWHHCSLFPDSFKLNEEHVDELRDILMHAVSDHLTSLTSTVPYPMSELQQMLSLVNNMRKNPSTNRMVAAYSRIMHIFVRQRFLNFHGQPSARLDRDRSIHHPKNFVPRKSVLLRCISPLLFSAPEIYYHALNKIWVDGLVHQATWAGFIGRLLGEWQELILFDTVLLNANVAFLAIQSVDDASDSPNRSPAQITSYLSVVASIGSVIVGLVLARKNRVKEKQSATDAALFLNSFVAKDRLGLETLAILYSMPYALLLWGVLLFLAAFSCMCLNASSDLVRSIFSSAWLIIAVSLLWCITVLSTWEHRWDPNKSFWERVFEGIVWVIMKIWRGFEAVVSGQVFVKATSWVVRKRDDENGSVHTREEEEGRNTDVRPTPDRKGSVGTIVVDLLRRSSLFSKTEKGTERKNSDDSARTVV